MIPAAGRLLLCVLGALVLVAATAGCGGDGGSADDAFEAVQRGEAERSKALRGISAPRWEPVRTQQGSGGGSARSRLTIAPGAIQWRASWVCERGTLELSLDGKRLARDTCPGRGRATSIETGDLELGVESTGPWELRVFQQVEAPLRELPPSSVASGNADRLASGSFYRIENRGQGRADLYRLPSGRLGLRLERFSTAANTDLFVWASEHPRPRTTKQVLASPHIEIGPLKSTLGDQNYVLPARLSPEAVQSVVIWCEPIQIAYTAAHLSG